MGEQTEYLLDYGYRWGQSLEVDDRNAQLDIPREVLSLSPLGGAVHGEDGRPDAEEVAL
ncbi:MAG: hypothetical protein WCG85_18785 [Polyangia bacterium]